MTDSANQFDGSFSGGSAATQPVSLSQTLLAPLDAIFKAQIHAARSFLNLLLQIGYPHVPLDKDGHKVPHMDSRPYTQDFFYDANINGQPEPHKISIPSLALLPITPLTIESANIKLEMNVTHVLKHHQIQQSEQQTLSQEQQYSREARPWFLVQDPISIRGTLAPSGADKQSQAAIQIEVKVGKVPMPAGLDKLLTHLTQSSHESLASTTEESDSDNESTAPSGN